MVISCPRQDGFSRVRVTAVRRTACGGAKDVSAIGGEIGGAGSGVEAEEGEAVERRVGRREAADFRRTVRWTRMSVLQAGKAQVDRVEAASQEIVFEVLDIGGSGLGGGVETPGLGLVQKVVDQWMSWPVASAISVIINLGEGKRAAARVRLGTGPRGISRPGLPVARFARRPAVLQEAGSVEDEFDSHGMIRMGCDGHE